MFPRDGEQYTFLRRLCFWESRADIITWITNLATSGAVVTLAKDWEVSIDHTLREANSCADFLAKMSAE